METKTLSRRFPKITRTPKMPLIKLKLKFCLSFPFSLRIPSTSVNDALEIVASSSGSEGYINKWNINISITSVNAPPGDLKRN